MKRLLILLSLFSTLLIAQPSLDIDIDNDGLIEVSNMETLNAIRHQLDGSGLRMSAEAEKLTTGCAVGGCRGYELTRDLDFLDAASYKDITNQKLWTSGAGWQPIGDREHPFNAVFKTNNSSTPHTIFNLRIHRSDEDNVGLFGNIGDAAEISGIGLLDAEVVGRHQVGGLIGENVGGRVSNSYASGQVIGSGGAVGLLIGSNSGAITNSYADGEVSGKDNSIGGLVGVNSGNISNSYAMGSVAGEANNVGGLVGDNSQGTVSNSYASASVSGSEDIGGLVGLSNLGTLVKNYVSGKATGIRYVGGLVGMNIGGTVSYSYWDKTTSQLEGNSDGVGLSASDLQSASAQNDDLSKPFYQWSTADWDFGTEEQYPILKYATGTDAENPVCGPEFSLPNCGSLLLGQHASLKRILLLTEATLTPRFKPTQFNYHLNITSAIKQLQLIPIANNPDSVIDISKNSTAINTNLANGTTSTAITLDSNTEITITVSASNQRPAHYRLTVNYLPTLTTGGIPSEAMDEGRLVILDAYQSIDAEGEALNYQWTQSVGKAIDLEATDQPILILRIPEDYVSEHAASAELGITVAVSDGKATVSQDIHIDINKIDNGILTVAAPTPSATEWTAPEIDLSEDLDGVGGNLQYQWQSRAPSEDAEWTDIDRATQQTYTPSILTAISTQYRVRISYTDGQGYETTLLGEAATYQPEIVTLDFAKAQATESESTPATQTTTTTEELKCETIKYTEDIDDNNNGLIEICDLEGLDAMRYQLDGSGYKASAGADKITTGCDAIGGCNGYELMRDLDFLEDASYRNPANKARWTIGDEVYSGYKGWQPIGTDIDEFNAIFEGNNHIIANLMIQGLHRLGLFGTAKRNTKIANVGLLNVDIKGGTWVGGIVGYLDGGSIMNSYVVGTVDGVDRTGGLAGHNSGSITNSRMVGTVIGRGFDYIGGLVGDNSGSITNSYTEGTVRGGAGRTGGLVGSNSSNSSSITNSYALGAVEGNKYVGGLVGYGRNITNSYAANVVKGNSSVGGLSGSSSSITNSYWDKTVGNRSGRYGLTTHQLQSPTMATGIYSSWSSDDWDFGTETEYPILKYARGSDSNNPACLDEATEESALQVCGKLLSPAIRYGLEDLRLAEGNLWPDFVGSITRYVGMAVSTNSTIQLIPTALKDGATISIEVDGAPINDGMMSGTTSSEILLKSEGTTHITLTVTNGGETTHTAVYTLRLRYHHYRGKDIDKDNNGLIEIRDLEGLNAIRYQLDGSGYREGSNKPKITIGCPNNRCKGYELVRSLDFWDENSYEDSSNRAIWTGKQSWQPLGDDRHRFTAQFDGNNHTISNLKVHKLTEYYLGLFGATGAKAEISNIELSNVDVSGDQYIGGLVGINYGKITNSRTTGKLSAAIGYRYYSGGLVGRNYGSILNSYSTIKVVGRTNVGGLVGLNNGVVINSYATGNIVGRFGVGGLVGRNTNSITNSYALGNVSGRISIGGLVGHNQRGSISDSYAHSKLLMAEDHYAGGLVGATERSTITRSYAVSQEIKADNPDQARGLVGLNIRGGSVSSDSYWDTDTSGKTISDGGTSKTTIQLQQPTEATEIYANWSSDNWHFGTETQYPTLKYASATGIGYPTCNEPTPTEPNPPIACGSIIPTVGRPGLEKLTLVAGYLSPEFIPTTPKYKGAVVHDSNIIQLIPTALNPKKDKIMIKADGMESYHSIESGATSDEITLNEDGTTTITLVVMTAQGNVPYNLSLRYHHHTEDIDQDDDGLIEIKDFEELNAMRHQLDGSGYRENSISPKITVGCPNNDCKGYELIADLDFNKSSYAATVAGWRPIGVRDNGFKTIFEGNGHTISNVRVNRPQLIGVGLFGYVFGGSVIRNIGMLNVDMKGSARVGGLIGDNKGGVKNSYATGSVIGQADRVGGLVGFSFAGQIMNSYVSGDVRGYSHVGGLVGGSWITEITDSYATGMVQGNDNIGGLVGRIYNGKIENSYAIARVSGGSSEVGGLIGRRWGIVTSSYWDRQASGKSSSRGGSGKTTAQLQTPTTPGTASTDVYYGWSSDDWDFGTAQHYPALKYAEHCGTSPRTTCGTLLPAQYPSLLDALAVKNNDTLSPTFNPETFRYEVEVDFDVDTLTLSTTATATGASIRISSNLTPTAITDDNTVHAEMPLTIAAPTVITIEVTTPGQRPTPYQLHVTHKIGDPDNIPIVRIRTYEYRDEGDPIIADIDNNSESTIYQWHQITPPSTQLVYTKDYTIPAYFIKTGDEQQQLELKFGARNKDGIGYPIEEKTEVTVRKEDNGAAEVVVVLKGSDISASITKADPDGGIQPGSLSYQWQRWDNEWQDIIGADKSDYKIPVGTTDTTRYRVQLNYIDQQGYEYTDMEEILSPAVIYRDIDVDDDGLIEISTLEELNAVRYQLDGTGYKENDDADKFTVGCPADGCKGYELVRDLDFNDDDSYSLPFNKVRWTTGEGWEPIGEFLESTFKGNNHTISNLMINRDDRDNVGLFAGMKGNAEIDGVSLYRVDIRGEDQVGALVGINRGGTITNVGVDGTVTGIGGEIGGVVGVINSGGEISISYSAAKVIGEIDDNNKMGNSVGGLVGINRGRIFDSYATGKVTGNDYVGGLVGEDDGKGIMNSYAIGIVMGDKEVGNLVGYSCSSEANENSCSSEANEIENSYWNTDINDDITGDDNGVGLSGTAMKATDVPTEDIYSGWDTAVWDFGTSEQYPVLRYRSDECSEANPPSYCGDLLAGQRLGLQSLKLSSSAILLEDFASERLNYTVLTDRDPQHIHTTPTAASPDAEISTRSMDNEITITVIANKRTVKYTLTVERLTVKIKSGDTVITEHTFTEGEQADLKASFMNEHDLSPLHYRWSQSSDGDNLLETVEGSMDGSVEGSDLYFTVPADYVESNTSSTDVTLIQEMTISKGNKQLNLSAEVTLTINKKNNDTITTAEIGKPNLNDLQITAPAISDILSLDLDGVNANPAIKYQWQWWNENTNQWKGIGATDEDYQVPIETEDETRYRVLISYTDGQSYKNTVASNSITFIDIDRDNDGLIEIETADQLNAIRHQLSGSGYRKDATATLTSLGCLNNVCKGYELKAHIDLSDLKPDKDWQPLGSDADPFNAIFEGNNYTISNLTITTTTNYVGLFAATSERAVIRNVGLLNVDITAGNNVGGLVGHNKGTIAYSHVGLLNVSITANENVGGLVGSNAGTIAYSHVVGKYIEGNSAVGGLVGYNTHKVTTSHAIVKEIISKVRKIGGLIGESEAGVITHSYAKVDDMKIDDKSECEKDDSLSDKLIGSDDNNTIIESAKKGICTNEKLFSE